MMNEYDHDNDDDSCTTLGQSSIANSEALLAPTPSPKASPNVFSPATQTLNTLSQSHHLDFDEEHFQIEVKKKQKKKEDKPSICLPWRTRTERKNDEAASSQQWTMPTTNDAQDARVMGDSVAEKESPSVPAVESNNETAPPTFEPLSQLDEDGDDDEQDESLEFFVHRIVLTQPGSLGLTIADRHIGSHSYCAVVDISGQSLDVDLEIDDYLIGCGGTVNDDDDDDEDWLSYEECLHYARLKERPLIFRAARRRNTTIHAITADLEAATPHLSAETWTETDKVSANQEEHLSKTESREKVPLHQEENLLNKSCTNSAAPFSSLPAKTLPSKYIDAPSQITLPETPIWMLERTNTRPVVAPATDDADNNKLTLDGEPEDQHSPLLCKEASQSVSPALDEASLSQIGLDPTQGLTQASEALLQVQIDNDIPPPQNQESQHTFGGLSQFQQQDRDHIHVQPAKNQQSQQTFGGLSQLDVDEPSLHTENDHPSSQDQAFVDDVPHPLTQTNDHGPSQSQAGEAFDNISSTATNKEGKQPLQSQTHVARKGRSCVNLPDKLDLNDLDKFSILFCNPCSVGDGAIHHFRCPKNVDRFDKHEYITTVEGYNLGCMGCKSEHQYGQSKRRHDLCKRAAVPSRHRQAFGSSIAEKSKTCQRRSVQGNDKSSPPNRVSITTPGKRRGNAASRQTGFHFPQRIRARDKNQFPVDFCRLCSGRSSVKHHKRCPKNQDFDQAKFLEMVKGYNKGCTACKTIYRYGCDKGTHSKCERGVAESQITLMQSSDDEQEKHNVLVPFCKACKTQRGDHHKLCPHHHTFDTSGAKETLECILAGVEVGCKACLKRYQGGSPMFVPHGQQCPRRGKTGRVPKRKDNDRCSPISIHQSLLAAQASQRKRGAFISVADTPKRAPKATTSSEKARLESQPRCSACIWEGDKTKGGTHLKHYEDCLQNDRPAKNLAKRRKRNPAKGDPGRLKSTKVKIKLGIELGCSACIWERDKNRKGTHLNHHEDCPQNAGPAKSVAKRRKRNPPEGDPSRLKSTKEKMKLGIELRCSACIWEGDKNRRGTHLNHHEDCPRNARQAKSASKRRKRNPPKGIPMVVDEDGAFGPQSQLSHTSTTTVPSGTEFAGTVVDDKIGSVTPDLILAAHQRMKPVAFDAMKRWERGAGQSNANRANEKIGEQQQSVTIASLVAPSSSKAKSITRQPNLESQSQGQVEEDIQIETQTRSSRGQRMSTSKELPVKSKSRTEQGTSARDQVDVNPNFDSKHEILTSIRTAPTAEFIKKNANKATFLDECVQISEVVVPFCRACRKASKSDVHHALCPQHPHFSSSGALEKLEIIRYGTKRDCAACTVQYENGCMGKHKVGHSDECQRFDTECRKKKESGATVNSSAPGQQNNLAGNRKVAKKSHDATQRNDFLSPRVTKKQKSSRHLNAVTPDERARKNYGTKVRLDSQVRIIKQTWKNCENPWGPLGYQFGDVAISGDGGFTHHEAYIPGKRFTVDPFGTELGYKATHFSPRETTHTLKLTRDAMSIVPWEFSIEHHEFGGACLVEGVDPNSPAADATFVGTSEHAPLYVHDMIVALNGKDISGWTEAGVEIELETSGVELTATVSRYRFPSVVDTLTANLETETWTNLDISLRDKRNLGWCELDLTAKFTMKSQLLKGVESDRSLSQHNVDFDEDMVALRDRLSLSQAQMQVAGIDNIVEEVEVTANLEQTEVANRSHEVVGVREEQVVAAAVDEPEVVVNVDVSKTDSVSCEDWANDENPWVGCVCNVIHEGPATVFWIQCEGCDTWYNVAPDCIGFDEERAQSLSSWTCRACPTDDDDD